MRNYHCSHYLSCLDHACRTGAPWTDCRGCPDQHNTDAAPVTPGELAGIAALLSMVLFGIRIAPGDITAGDLVAPSADERPWADFYLTDHADPWHGGGA